MSPKRFFTIHLKIPNLQAIGTVFFLHIYSELFNFINHLRDLGEKR